MKPLIGEPEFEFHHSMPVQIRFTDIDMLGHLNNSIYLQFMDLAKVDYFTRVNERGIDWNNLDLVIANINSNFLAQTKFGEQLLVLTQTYSIGHKSLQLHQRILSADTGELKCVATTVMVSVDLDTGITKPVSEQWIADLSAYEGRQLQQPKAEGKEDSRK